ncbi:MAG: hypothetical protein OEV06_08355 [Anaerolineae bacterium]|nr:hypothetical protein [Anaerolineae bacterium]
MSELIRFLQTYENAIYFLLGLGGILYAWRFWNAWYQLRISVYGLEKEVARQDLNRAAIYLFLVFVIGAFVFSTVTFTGSMVDVEDMIATPTLQLSGDIPSSGTPGDTPGAGPSIPQTPTPLPTVSVNPEFCIEGRIIIATPTSGETVRGEIAITGTVDVERFGFFQVEYARLQDGLWLPIAVKRNVVINGDLVSNWDTSIVPAGDYILQLLVTDNDGVEYDACRIPIHIESME